MIWSVAVGRPTIFDRPMTNAEHQRRHRERHGRGPDPTNAGRQARWRARQRTKLAEGVARVVERFARPSTPEPDPQVSDPLFARAQAILESRGEVDLIHRLRAAWPYMEQPVKQSLAEGRGFRFWLRD
jgi:hypothetical protein